MKRMNILVVKLEGGRRTSITVSDYQLDLLDRLAEFKGMSRTKLIQKIYKEYEPSDTNFSNYVRDYMLGTLVDILSMKGVDL